MRPVFLRVEAQACKLEQWWLTEGLGDSSELNRLVAFGGIYLNGQRLPNWDQSKRITLRRGDILRIYQFTKRFPINSLGKENILYEDTRIVAVDKPAGLPGLPVASNAIENCKYFLEQSLGCKLFPLHRLDEATAGVLLFCKHASTVAEFHHDLKHDRMARIYLALTQKPLKRGPHNHFMKKAKDRMLCFDVNIDGAKPATLVVENCELQSSKAKSKRYLSHIRLITGRTHQIRCQLAHIGAPIVGDAIYSGQSLNEETPLGLVAKRLHWQSYNIESTRKPSN